MITSMAKLKIINKFNDWLDGHENDIKFELLVNNENNSVHVYTKEYIDGYENKIESVVDLNGDVIGLWEDGEIIPFYKSKYVFNDYGVAIGYSKYYKE